SPFCHKYLFRRVAMTSLSSHNQPYTHVVPLPDNALEVLAFLGSELRSRGQLFIFGGQLVIVCRDRGQVRPQLGDRLIFRSRPDGPIASQRGHLGLGHGQLVPDSACPQSLLTGRNLNLMLRSTQSVLEIANPSIFLVDSCLPRFLLSHIQDFELVVITLYVLKPSKLLSIDGSLRDRFTS